MIPRASPLKARSRRPMDELNYTLTFAQGALLHFDFHYICSFHSARGISPIVQNEQAGRNALAVQLRHSTKNEMIIFVR
jgi:hypothetical protein